MILLILAILIALIVSYGSSVIIHDRIEYNINNLGSPYFFNCPTYIFKVTGVTVASALLVIFPLINNLSGLIFTSIFIGFLVIVSIVDLKTRIINDSLLLKSTLIFAFAPYLNVKGTLQQYESYAEGIWGAVGVFLLAIISINVAEKISKKKVNIGGGDIKIFVPLGLMLGYHAALNVLILSCFISPAFWLIYMKYKKVKISTFPMAPSICLISFVFYVYSYFN